MLTVLAAVVASLLLGRVIRGSKTRSHARSAARTQRLWDEHVADAVALCETPIHDALASVSARDLDAEWRQISSGGWATE